MLSQLSLPWNHLASMYSSLCAIHLSIPTGCPASNQSPATSGQLQDDVNPVRLLHCVNSAFINLNPVQCLFSQTLLYECVKPARDWLATELAKGSSTPIHKMFQTAEGGLSYKYHSSWGQVLQILRSFFEVRCSEWLLSLKCLGTFCTTQNTNRLTLNLHSLKTMIVESFPENKTC